MPFFIKKYQATGLLQAIAEDNIEEVRRILANDQNHECFNKLYNLKFFEDIFEYSSPIEYVCNGEYEAGPLAFCILSMGENSVAITKELLRCGADPKSATKRSYHGIITKTHSGAVAGTVAAGFTYNTQERDSKLTVQMKPLTELAKIRGCLEMVKQKIALLYLAQIEDVAKDISELIGEKKRVQTEIKGIKETLERLKCQQGLNDPDIARIKAALLVSDSNAQATFTACGQRLTDLYKNIGSLSKMAAEVSLEETWRYTKELTPAQSLRGLETNDSTTKIQKTITDAIGETWCAHSDEEVKAALEKRAQVLLEDQQAYKNMGLITGCVLQ